MGTEVEPRVSVVTPLYNGAAFLSECIESVLDQTYANLEYVIADNCSTDDSLDIAKRYARSDSRIRIETPPEHLSMMANWNFALSKRDPAAKYCKVVHADDWLKPSCLQLMVELAEAHPSVGIVGAYRLEEDRANLRGVPPGRPVLSGKEVGSAVLRGEMSVFGSPTQLLIRSNLIEAPFYDESLINADKDACLRLLVDHDFGFVSEILTYTRRHNESKSSQIFRLDPRRVENLVLLKRYGVHYLGEAFAEQWALALASHHRYLARRLLNGSSEEYWAFQRETLGRIGERVSRVRLAWELFLQLANLPDTLRRLMGRRKRVQRPAPRAR